MATSSPDQLPVILDALLRKLPKSVLDIGVGFGKWGVLVHEYCDIYSRRARIDRPGDWMVVDGVEIDRSYKNPIYDIFYQNIWWNRIENILGELPHYDAILWIDVIEHLDKETGLHVLRRLIPKTDLLIVSTPNGYAPQKVAGKPNEDHVCGWTTEEFMALGAARVELVQQSLRTNQLVAFFEKR